MVEEETSMKPLAEEVITKFGKIAAAASDKLGDGHVVGSNALASINTMTSDSTVHKIDKINQANRESYLTLASEPAIARVVVADSDGNEQTYYICRTSPVSGISNLASYLAPVGRLASLGIGAEFKMPNGRTVEVLERSHLRPVLDSDGWDSRRTVVETELVGPITIESLRLLLSQAANDEFTEDLLDQILMEESKKANIFEGVRRSVITKMGLRDQPVLDEYQDEIFRLPLDNRLFIFGPPGTGKTTTLIRRLGQKIDEAFLDETEKRLVNNANSSLSHRESWLMFTPTELLKQYLKEAFAREGVPASDLRIRTWHEFRRELARNTYGILKTASGGGTFVLKESIETLKQEAMDNPIAWHDDFCSWQFKAALESLLEAANLLSNSEQGAVQDLGKRLSVILNQVEEEALSTTFEAIAVLIPQIQELVGTLKADSDHKIKAALNHELNRDRSFLDEFARFLDGLQQTQAADPEEQDEPDIEEEEETSIPRTGRAAALTTYMQAVRAQARSVASKRSLSKTSRFGKIIDWLGPRTLVETDSSKLGASLLVQSSARRFLSPVKQYLEGIPKRYRTFRRQRQEEGAWYRNEGFESKEIHPLELDLILLRILRTSADLLRKPSIQKSLDNQPWSPLKPTLELYRNQILVDEVTDFSPFQLGCMVALSHPQLRSFFACGDFHQRLTVWGTSSEEISNGSFRTSKLGR